MAPSPSPTIPPKPSVKQARVEGTYKITFILIHSNVDGREPRKTYNRWIVEPRCRRGPCDVSVRAMGGNGGAKYLLRGLFVHGQYRFHRHVSALWTCTIGSTTRNLEGNLDYIFTAAKVALVDGEWVAAKLQGSLVETGTGSCGFLAPAGERFLIRAS